MAGRVIVDIQGIELTQDDRDLISHPQVAGIILFSRNFKSIEQLKDLTAQIKSLRSLFIIAVDQEGGRVQRFHHGFINMPSMSYWGKLFLQDPNQAKRQLSENVSLSSKQLIDAGINFNLIPVLDVDQGISQVIGERSFNTDPRVVSELGRCVIEILHQNKLPAIGKHFPGHGGVALDSHLDVPVDSRSWEDLKECDLQPFYALSDVLDAIMPAHVIYKSVDDLPTTFSSVWLKDILRKKMGYQGLVISDDLSMSGATKIYSDSSQRAISALSAGCDLVLVCNDRKAAWEIANSLIHYPMEGNSHKRIEKYIRNLL